MTCHFFGIIARSGYSFVNGHSICFGIIKRNSNLLFINIPNGTCNTINTVCSLLNGFFTHATLPLTPKDSSDITVAFETSVAVVSNSFLELFLQLITPNAAMTATLKITFLIFLILKFILVYYLFYNLFYFTTSKHGFSKIRIDYLFLFA